MISGQKEKYLISLKPDQSVAIVLHTAATQHDILQALFHVVTVVHACRSLQNGSIGRAATTLGPMDQTRFTTLVRETLPGIPAALLLFTAEANARGWRSSSLVWVDHGVRAVWAESELVPVKHVDIECNCVKPL